MEFIVATNKKKSQSSSAIGDKAVHVANLMKKGNWPQIRKLASEGNQAAVDALNKRSSVTSAAKEEKQKKSKNK